MLVECGIVDLKESPHFMISSLVTATHNRSVLLSGKLCVCHFTQPVLMA